MVACGEAGEVRAGALRLTTRAWPRPGRPRALLLHSLAAHSHWWDWAAPLLAERFDVLALDFRGHGGSDRSPDGTYRFEDYVGDVAAVIAALGGAPPVVMGHSLGGYIAAMLAARRTTSVAGVVIADVLTSTPEALERFARRQAERPPAELESPAAAGERFRLSPPDTTAAPDRLRHLGEAGVTPLRPGVWTHAFDPRVFLQGPIDPWPFLPRIAVPALVVNGGHSTVMDAETGRRVAAAIPGGRAVTLAGAHHHLIVEAPDDFSRTVLAWHRAMI